MAGGELDVITVEVYANVRGPVPTLPSFITAMERTGIPPCPLLEVHVAPLDKPKKDPFLSLPLTGEDLPYAF